ncbi:hypothetical protein QFC21_006306 [Naganishia friedmannii]|uniref:Uncharacterized protein n=1 Tax=Naganishia friedmannii TaxID=89922 RepID=A0ACC2V3K8_9TREE|nr:hypothetical protein QFC21_006306 [Naganishia friedmannii]
MADTEAPIDLRCQRFTPIVIKDENHSTAVPPSQFKINLQEFIGHIKAIYPTAAIILLTPSTLEREAVLKSAAAFGVLKKLVDVRVPEAAKAIRNVVLQVAADEQGNRPPEDAVADEETKLEELLMDGLYYSAKGYSGIQRLNWNRGFPYVNRAIIELIKDTSAEISPENVDDAFDLFACYRQEDNPEAEKRVGLIEDYRTRTANVTPEHDQRE